MPVDVCINFTIFNKRTQKLIHYFDRTGELQAIIRFNAMIHVIEVKKSIRRTLIFESAAIINEFWLRAIFQDDLTIVIAIKGQAEISSICPKISNRFFFRLNL